MRQGHVVNLTRLSSPPDSSPGSCPVIRVVTDYTGGSNNAFYMEPSDMEGNPVSIPTTAKGDPTDSNMIQWNDPIQYDVSNGLKKKVIWKGREFRQRRYSFHE